MKGEGIRQAGARSGAVGLTKRDNASELMRWGVSLAAIAAVHAVVAFGLIQRDEETRSNEAPEAAIMIDLPPELDLPPAESVESTAASAAEEIEAPETVEPPPPETAEAIEEPMPTEPVEETVRLEETPLEEIRPDREAETLTAEAPEAVEALPPEDVPVSDVALPAPPRVVERPRPPRKETARPPRQQRPAERARPTPQRQQASRAAVAGQRASGAGAPNRNALRTFMASVRADIMRQRRSVSAQGNGRTATVRFTIAANGALQGIAVARSSGDPDLDAAAVSMVRRASPVSPIPDGVGRSTLSSRLPVQFN